MDEFNNRNHDEENQNTQPIHMDEEHTDETRDVQWGSDGTYRSGRVPADDLSSRPDTNTDAEQNTQPYATERSSSSQSQQNSAYSQNPGWSAPHTQASSGYSGGDNGGGPNGPTYSQWSSGGADGPQRPRKHSALRVVGGIALAVVVVGGAFAGGLMAGNLVDLSGITAQTDSDDTTNTLPENSTKLELAETRSSTNETTASGALSGKEIYQKVTKSVVTITVSNLAEDSAASGSGVIMSEDGYVITNAHVVEGGSSFTVTLYDGKTTYNAKMVGSDAQTDLAVLKVEAKDLDAAEFGDSSKIEVGDRCFAIGSPLGIEFENSFTGGYVSAIDRDVTVNDYVMTLIQTDASINAGNSGGALINEYGQVIGITNSKLSSSSYGSQASIEGMAFAIPTSTVQEIVNELIANGRVTGRPAIGISGYNITEARAQYSNVPQGVVVSQIDLASDAYQQGVQVNDIIIAVNGETITTMDEINAVKEKLKVGDSLTLTVYRNGSNKKIKVKLIDQADLSGTYASSSSSSQSGRSGYGNFGNSGDDFFGGYGFFGN